MSSRGYARELSGVHKRNVHICVLLNMVRHAVIIKGGHGVVNLEKSGKPPKYLFEFLTLVTRHRFFFFVPETLNQTFSENPKRRALENDRDLSFQKLIWSHMMPFGVSSDPSFRAQKQRIRVRGCVFWYRRDSKCK